MTFLEMLAALKAEIDSMALREQQLVDREEKVLAREKAATEFEIHCAAIRLNLDERAQKLENMEKSIGSVRSELAQRKARIVTLEGELADAVTKMRKAREEKGAIQARLTALIKAVKTDEIEKAKQLSGEVPAEAAASAGQ